MLDPCPPKTRADLEWQRLLDALAERTVSEAGRQLALALPFCDSLEEVRVALDEGREATALDTAGEPLPVAAIDDIAGAIDRARIGAALSNEELRAVMAALLAGRTLRRFLAAHKDEAPALQRVCATDPTLDKLERLLSESFEPDGTLSDRASPRLAALRAEARAARARVLRRLEDLLSKHGGIMQDAYWTERDGRFVLPIRADAHERFPGIVHGASASGATLFVEPRGVVELGNRLKMLESDIAREEQAIYAALSTRVGEDVLALEVLARVLAHADLRAASVKLASAAGLAFPEVLDTEGEVDLVAARHPLLALSGAKVVASDIAISAARAMVVSGPNAGGKTVSLKVVGLAALLLRAGLPVPAAPGSRLSVFERVLTDVGDDQSLRANLSTFSAHITNIARILDETHGGVLVLLDELAGGTDPREGEALAAAVLDSLTARGGTIACTTHYEGLKALAVHGGRFVNASVGFDLATLSPTFKLALGLPGSSSALAVARRFGMPSLVVERAQAMVARGAASFEETVKKLEDERQNLELARIAVERDRQEWAEKHRALDAERARLADKERRAIESEGAAVLAGLRRARRELDDAEGRIRRRPAESAELRDARAVVDAVAKKVTLGGELEPVRPEQRSNDGPPLASELRLGLKVFVPKLRADAEIVEVLPGDKLRVAAGSMKLTLRLDEVRARAGQERKAAPAKRPALPYDAASDPDVPMQTSENTADLRGLRADEAVAMAEQFLDRSLQDGRRVAFLIHGHGTGALRLAVRDALRGSRYVTRSRPGEQREGGDGVTVVWLR